MRSRRILPLLALALAVLHAGAPAQTTDRDRTALRRAQAALQQAQQAREAAEAEARSQGTARSEAEARLTRQQAEQAGLRRALAEARAALAAAQATHATALDAERQRQAQAEAARTADEAARTQAWRGQLADSERLAEERRLANAALVQQLAQRSAALADAERRIDALHGLGGELLQRYRDKGRLEQALQNEPVFGLVAVRQEDRITRLQEQLDQLRQPTPPAAGAGQ
ncbi:hypothetical protein [Pseudaquabacterium pictum]|uniref:Uncharacterized protein n=1 Tax=Pseudaquabacterium pictum TaxID=2315236 RepID=A0A480AQ43_9BURK|nr:hypothetical protein [Rubrivivax pictus]GCL62920.1 hypothetical protein AQPW35_20010 [Rubrivivax pictus]